MTEMAFVWQWPQITWLVMAGLHLLQNYSSHGQSRGSYHAGWANVNIIIVGALLYYGGFFTEARP